MWIKQYLSSVALYHYVRHTHGWHASGLVFWMEHHNVLLKYLKVCLDKLCTSASLSTKVTYICVTQHKSYEHLCHSAQKLWTSVSLSTKVTYICVTQHKSYVHLCHLAQKLRTSVSLSTKVTYVCVTQHKSYEHLCHSAQKLCTSASLSTRVTYICVTQHKSYIYLCHPAQKLHSSVSLSTKISERNLTWMTVGCGGCSRNCSGGVATHKRHPQQNVYCSHPGSVNHPIIRSCIVWVVDSIVR